MYIYEILSRYFETWKYGQILTIIAQT